jgi:hypothetical protein
MSIHAGATCADKPISLWQKSGQAECLPHQLCKLLNLLRWRRRFRLRSGSGRLLQQAAIQPRGWDLGLLTPVTPDWHVGEI